MVKAKRKHSGNIVIKLNKNFFIGLIITGIVIYALTSGVLSPVKSNSVINSANSNITVEVIHFHATQQCYSCITVGALAGQTVTQLNNSRINFTSINIDLPENKELVSKYGAKGSAIMIGVYIGDQFRKEENTNVWYKINNATDYLNYFSALLTRRINGDFS